MTTRLTVKRWIATVILAWFCSISAANAALLGLIPDPLPDIKHYLGISYVYSNGTDASGGFTMTMDGFATAVDFGTGITPPAGDCFGFACYDLDATFDSSGSLTGGSLFITYTGTYDYSPDGGATILTANSGLILEADLTAFGFGSYLAGSPPTHGSFGLFEFAFEILGGDYGTLWGGANGGTIIDTRDLLDSAGFTLDTGGQTWDDFGLMTTEFQASLFDLNTSSDTFIPIPAAVWLFGSGLGLLAAIGRKRKVRLKAE